MARAPGAASTPLPEPVAAELAARLGRRERMSALTSGIGYATQALLMADVANLRLLLLWVLGVAGFEMVNLRLSLGLMACAADAPARRLQLCRLCAGLYASGATWGLGVLIVAPTAHPAAHMLNLTFVAVVGVFSVQNLAYHRPAQAAFVLGLATGVLLQAAWAPGAATLTAAAAAVVLLVMIAVYTQTAHQLIVSDIVSGQQVLRLSSELRDKNQALEAALAAQREQALRDPLTGMLNRRAGHERLDDACTRQARSGTPFGVVMVDLDHFKRINDSHGHQVGDAVLVAAAHRLRARLRSGDALVRWGGEEFLCIVDGVDAAGLEDVAGQLCRALAAAPLLEPPVTPLPLTVTGSFGHALHRAGLDVDHTIGLADQALYAAKAGGRNRAVAAGAGARSPVSQPGVAA